MSISLHFETELRLFAEEMAKRSREVIRDVRRSGLDLETKADFSVVTAADTRIEEIFIEAIKEKYPSHGVLGEEFPPHQIDAEFVWTIDPIDGTEEFANGFVTYGCIIGLTYQKRSILGVIDHFDLDQLISGTLQAGAFFNGQPIRKTKPIGKAPRLGCSKPRQFLRNEGSLDLFHKVVELFPNLTTYGSAYVYTNGLLGGFDVLLDHNGMVYESAAVVALAKALGFSCYTSYEEGVVFPAKDRVTFMFGHDEELKKLYELFKRYYGETLPLYRC
jgi:myo-inositol-1(or 4)-monophosphatase